MEQLIYLILAIVAGIVVIKLYTSRISNTRKRLTPQQAKARLDSGDALTLLDVRTREEFASGHIPGAVCLPVEELSAQTAAKILPEQTGEVLVYCRSGRRSARAARFLADQGYTAVRDFGGILDWPYETTQE